MKKLLHIIVSPRDKESSTLEISESFLDKIKGKYPELEIDELNLFKEKLPPLTVEQINGKYVLMAGEEISGDTEKSWKDIVKHIERFLSADTYLISTPMWNFNIPYIDIIVQPKYLFQYTDKGPQGLAKDKKMVIITSRGGDYSPGTVYNSYDFQEPYLKAIFGFVGINGISFINAQPMDALGPEVKKQRIEQAKELVSDIIINF